MNPEPGPPYDPSDGSFISNIDNINNKDDGNGNDIDDAVNGPTMEAYVDLAKTACNFYSTRYCLIHILIYVCSAQGLP